jgi:hypothetical protein
LDTNDRVLLTKIFTENTSIVFNELKGFKQLQQKLLKANAIEGFFESVGFKGYLIEMEAIVLKKCFNRQERHSPIMYVEYLLSKLKWNVGFSMEQELKLGIKSLLFRRVTKM